jgi:hypothetical protein
MKSYISSGQKQDKEKDIRISGPQKKKMFSSHIFRTSLVYVLETFILA